MQQKLFEIEILRERIYDVKNCRPHKNEKKFEKKYYKKNEQNVVNDVFDILIF